jgi:hypothetical protein
MSCHFPTTTIKELKATLLLPIVVSTTIYVGDIIKAASTCFQALYSSSDLA